MKKSIIILNLIVLAILFFYSSTAQQHIVLSNLAEDSTSNPILVASKMNIHSPVKDQQVFTYEDIVPFGGLIPIYVHRANFSYILESNSESFFRTKLEKVFNQNNTSPVTIDINADFKYFLEERNFANNIVNIYMNVAISIINDSTEVLKKSFEAIENEKYSTAMLTYPRNKTMNSLFNKALNSIINLILSDPDFKKLNQ